MQQQWQAQAAAQQQATAVAHVQMWQIHQAPPSSSWERSEDYEWNNKPRHQWHNGFNGNRGPSQNRKDDGRFKKAMEDLKGARAENFELRQEQLEKLQEKNTEILAKDFEIQNLKTELETAKKELEARKTQAEEELLQQKTKRKDSTSPPGPKILILKRSLCQYMTICQTSLVQLVDNLCTRSSEAAHKHIHPCPKMFHLLDPCEQCGS